MDNQDIKKVSGKRHLQQEIATRTTDPNFYGALSYLPNPDQVLRKLGRTEEVFDALVYDPHIIGELRSIRSGLTGYEWRLQPGGESPADIRAYELALQVMKHRPAPGMTWNDTIWNMAHGVFRGHRVHEIVWKREGSFIVPGKVLDRPNRRFVFSTENELRLRTRDKPVDGIELEDRKWLLTRHMPSYDNPYGIALFSACFWPYTFKHNGFKYFVKFCEKYGLPWAIGRYPSGTPKKDQDELADALAVMVEDAVAAIPEGGAVELLESKHSGEIVHEHMINICNREMSKALTSQTLATEIQGEGSRAASETHRDREESVNASDRWMICDTFNTMFTWLTEINIAGAKPPTFEFYQEEEARQEWVEVFKDSREFMDIPQQFAHDRLQIPLPKEGEAVLPRTGTPLPQPGNDFSACPGCGRVHDHTAADEDDEITQLATQASAGADEIIEAMTDQVRELLDKADTLEEFRDGLLELYPKMDEQRLGEYTALALMTGMLNGVEEAK